MLSDRRRKLDTLPTSRVGKEVKLSQTGADDLPARGQCSLCGHPHRAPHAGVNRTSSRLASASCSGSGPAERHLGEPEEPRNDRANAPWAWSPERVGVGMTVGTRPRHRLLGSRPAHPDLFVPDEAAGGEPAGREPWGRDPAGRGSVEGGPAGRERAGGGCAACGRAARAGRAPARRARGWRLRSGWWWRLTSAPGSECLGIDSETPMCAPCAWSGRGRPSVQNTCRKGGQGRHGWTRLSLHRSSIYLAATSSGGLV